MLERVKLAYFIILLFKEVTNIFDNLIFIKKTSIKESLNDI